MKKLALLTIVLFTGVSALAGPLTDWTLQRQGQKESFKAQVPCTVAGVLNEAGVFGQDVLDQDRYKAIDKSIFDDAWVFTTQFKAPKGQRNVLRFEGLNYYADIELNGKLIASRDTTFGPYCVREFDITALAKAKNTLKVTLRRAHEGDLNAGYVDWNPRPVDESMGIIRPVTLISTPDVQVQDVFVKPLINTKDFSKAQFEAQITLVNRSNKAVEGTVEGSYEGGKFSVPAQLAAGETKLVTVTETVENPRIWWTAELGKPELYHLDVAFCKGKKVSHSAGATFGLRSIESEITPFGHRQFILNGQKVLVKSAGWTDDIFMQDTPESLEAQVKMVADMGLNSIRFENIWGKDHTIYDLCDQYGLMALVGFSCQWEWENYCGLPEVGHFGCINGKEVEDLAVRYFHDQVVRLHNHPSVIAWLTGSDRIPNPGLEERYLAIFEKEDYRPYVCSAKNMKSLAGWSGAKMEGPYEYVGPDYWYVDTKAGGAFGWNTETGIGANLPQLESLKRMIPEEALWPLSDVWDYHCTASTSDMNTTKVLQETVNALYGGFDSLEDFVRKAHAVDYDGTRAMFEAFRIRVPKTTGIVQWMLNSAWPSLYWQQYDWYGVPTAGYYGTKKACEPRQLLFDYATRKVCAVNESCFSGDLTAKVRVYDAASRLIGEETRAVKAGYREVVPVFDLKRYDGKPHFVALQLLEGDTPVADNFYCLGAKDNTYAWDKENWYVTPISQWTDLRFVFGQKEADVEMTVEDGRVTLTNRSDILVPMVILKAKDTDGNLVVPAYWSDNFFPLLPGEKKTVSCQVESLEGIHFELDK